MISKEERESFHSSKSSRETIKEKATVKKLGSPFVFPFNKMDISKLRESFTDVDTWVPGGLGFEELLWKLILIHTFKRPDKHIALITT